MNIIPFALDCTQAARDWWQRNRSSRTGFEQRRHGGSRRIWRNVSGVPKELRAWFARFPSFATMTRQRQRAAAREAFFSAVSEQYSGEPRKARRKMALAMARKRWREA